MIKKYLYFLFIALIVGTTISLFASGSPDGLEKVAEDQGFLGRAVSWVSGVMPDYLVPGIENELWGTAIAGFIGTLVVFGVLFLLGKMLERHKSM